MWIYVPLIWLQSYTLKRAFQRRAPTLVEEGGIGNYMMDLAAIFVGTKPFVYVFAASGTRYRDPVYASWTIQIAWWIIQVCLVVYTAVRYAWSFSEVIPRYLQAERCVNFVQCSSCVRVFEDGISQHFGRRNASSGDVSQASVPESLQPDDPIPPSSTSHDT